MTAILTFGYAPNSVGFPRISRPGTQGVKPVRGFAREALSLPIHEDFGILIDVTPLFSERVGPYRVVKPLDLQTYKNSDGFTSLFNVFPRIIGTGETSQESQDDAKRHLLHSREFYEALQPERGTQGAKRQSVLMKQYLEWP